MTDRQWRAAIYGLLFIMTAFHWPTVGSALFLTLMDFVENRRV